MEIQESNQNIKTEQKIDNLIDLFNYNTSIIWKPDINFINDLNIIINELKKYHSFLQIDIYELLVSCGHNLTWNREYLISCEDFNWFKNNNGKTYFFSNIMTKCISNEEYIILNEIYIKLIELFELQLDN